MAIIREHLERYPESEDASVFANAVGNPLRRTLFRARVWKPTVARSGLPGTLRFHDLRHSYATWLWSMMGCR